MRSKTSCLVYFLVLTLASGVFGQGAARPSSVAQFTDMSYPRLAREKNVTGVVVVRSALDDAGRVVAVDALSGPRELVAPTVANQRNWRYSAPSPQSSLREVVFVYDFRIEGRCTSATPSHFMLRDDRYAVVTVCRAESPIPH
jgi:hypothetical protein